MMGFMKRLPLTLDPELYDRLAEQAKAEDRDPIQQARVILRRALEAQSATPPAERPRK
jgi:hypothetical protein